MIVLDDCRKKPSLIKYKNRKLGWIADETTLYKRARDQMTQILEFNIMVCINAQSLCDSVSYKIPQNDKCKPIRTRKVTA